MVDRIDALKRSIALLEWDIRQIKNDKLRAFKQSRLLEEKLELEQLIRKKNSHSNTSNKVEV